MSTKVQDKKITIIKQFVAGGLAGTATKTSTAPLERIKILLQIQAMSAARDGNVKNLKYRGLFSPFKIIIREEGFMSLWKSNATNVLRVIPTYGLKFMLNDTFKDMVRKTPGEKLHFGQKLAAGTISGLFTTACTYPLDLVRNRLILGKGMGLYYTGFLHCVRTTFAKEGPLAFYKGYAMTALSGSPYVGIQMSAYDSFYRQMANDDGSVLIRYKIGSGVLAGLIAQTLTYPGDTCRRRMATNGANGTTKVYNGNLDCVKQVFRNEGFVGFYGGWRMNVIRSIPAAAIQFVAYEQFKKLLNC